jgi:hypothetical protein
MSKKRLYVRPESPGSPEAEGQALEALVKWGMECKADFDGREARRRAGERGSTPPPPPAPMAAKSK